MKIKTIITTLAIVCSLGNMANAQQYNDEIISYNPNAQFDSSKKSINTAAVGKIGEANIIIKYHSPGVRKRVIWGGLVPYHDVWVTGAHSATTLQVDKPFMVGNQTIAAGKYAIFTIPEKNEWTIIINKNWQQHLTDDYNAADDIIRIQATPTPLAKPLERLQYFITDHSKNKGTVAMGWDQLQIQFDIKVM